MTRRPGAKPARFGTGELEAGPVLGQAVKTGFAETAVPIFELFGAIAQRSAFAVDLDLTEVGGCSIRGAMPGRGKSPAHALVEV